MRYNRRSYLKASGLLAAGVVGLAGCADPPSRADKIHRWAKTDVWLAAGEGVGFEQRDDQWRITVTNIGPAGEIDVRAEKIVLDEVGQNKEGIDATYTFTRGDVELGDLVKIENDFRIGYIERNSDEVYLIMANSRLGADEVAELTRE